VCEHREALPRAEAVREDGRGYRDGRRQTGQGRDRLRRSQLPGASSRPPLSAKAGAGTGRGAQAHRAGQIRHHHPARILAAVLAKVAAPLKKADLLQIAQFAIARLPYSQAQTLAKRHKVEADKSNTSLESLLSKRIASYDETGLCRTLLELSLLDSAYQRGKGLDDSLLETAKRYRIDTVKIEKAVSEQMTAKEKKQSREAARKKKTAA